MSKFEKMSKPEFLPNLLISFYLLILAYMSKVAHLLILHSLLIVYTSKVWKNE